MHTGAYMKRYSNIATAKYFFRQNCSDSVVQRGQSSWKLIVGHFGLDVLRDDGQIDRAKLAAIIFDSEEKRRLLNSCTHPYIQRRMMWQAFKHFLKGEQYIERSHSLTPSPALCELGHVTLLMRSIG